MKLILLSITFAISVLVVYSLLIEPNNIKVEKVVVSSNALFPILMNMRVVQISDLEIRRLGYLHRKLEMTMRGMEKEFSVKH